MAQSRVSKPATRTSATGPADLGAWDKLQLGWLDYEIVVAGQNKTLDLGPHEYNSNKAQAVVVVLPKKQIVTQLVAPPEGTKSWWSGSGDDLHNSLSRTVALPAGTTTLTFEASWDIEDCGPTRATTHTSRWTTAPASSRSRARSATPAEGNGIDGTSGGLACRRRSTCRAYAGKTVGLRFRYFDRRCRRRLRASSPTTSR